MGKHVTEVIERGGSLTILAGNQPKMEMRVDSPWRVGHHPFETGLGRLQPLPPEKGDTELAPRNGIVRLQSQQFLQTVCCLTPFLLPNKEGTEIEARRRQLWHQLYGAAKRLLRSVEITCSRICHPADSMQPRHVGKLGDQTLCLGNDLLETPLFQLA